MQANPRRIKRVLSIFGVLWSLAGQRKMIEEGTIEAAPAPRSASPGQISSASWRG